MSIQSSSVSRTVRLHHHQKAAEVDDLIHLALQLSLEGASPDNVELLRWARSKDRLESLWIDSRRPDWILKVVDWADRVGVTDELDIRGLRLFACWCARGGQDGAFGPRAGGIIDVAERFASGAATLDELNGARLKGRGGAQGAAVCGMHRRNPRAAFQLATWHTVSESALASAEWASWYSLQGRQFELEAAGALPVKSETVPYSLRALTPALAGPSEHEAEFPPAIVSLRVEYAAKLRELVRNPFVNVDLPRLCSLRVEIDRSLAHRAN